jgi:transposase
LSAKAKLKKLSQEKFNCSDDATKALSKISKQFKYHQVDQIEITEKLPSHKDKKQNKYYQISTTVSQNENAINVEITGAGRFILATNVLESRELSNEQMITEYKAQQSCERGFRFLKVIFRSKYFNFLLLLIENWRNATFTCLGIFSSHLMCYSIPY